jgi:hypothetical protein
MFAASREEVAPFVRIQLRAQKVVITVFFTFMTLILSEALPRGRNFNQDYFIAIVLSELGKEKRQLLRRKR